MLSFMKENNGINKSDEQTTDGAGQDFLVPTSNSKTVKQTTIILMVLFTVGAACLWFMIKKTTPSEAEAAAVTEELNIENAIAQLTGIKTEMNDSMGEIVEKFHQFSDVDQIAVSELKKNPFRLELGLSSTDSDSESQINVEQRNQILSEQINKKAAKLQLLSTMASDKDGCCMINDKILYKGDAIDGFTVTAIRSNQVELISDGIPVTLRMPE